MWQRFIRAFAVSSGAGLALCLLLALLVDPLGVSPFRIVSKNGFALDDPRFFAPQVISDNQFDSYLVGTSTIHSVDPLWAESAFGGRFAIVALQGGTPYELSRVIRLLGQKPDLRRVIIGLDVTTWCKARGSERFRSDTVFPEWLYDKERFNDFEGLVNLKMLRFEIKQILIALGAKPAVPRNGYLNHLDDAKWTLSMARKKIYGDFTPTIRGKEHDEQTVVSANYPSLSLLDRALQALPASTEVIIALMPFHASVQDVTPAELENWKRCKQRIASFANGESRHVVDFFIISPWTTSDENFWDRSHFRTSIARAFMARLKEAIELGRDADDGTYVLATPSRLSTMDYQ